MSLKNLNLTLTLARLDRKPLLKRVNLLNRVRLLSKSFPYRRVAENLYKKKALESRDKQ